MYRILELESAVVSGGGGGVIHTAELVAVEREGQVVYHPVVVACADLSVALQPQDVAVLVVSRHLLVEDVIVAVHGGVLPVLGKGQSVQSVIGELVTTQGGFIARPPRHTADVAVVLRCTHSVRVVQALRELVPTDARHPVADVVAVRQLVGGVPVRGLALQPAHLVVRVRA